MHHDGIIQHAIDKTGHIHYGWARSQVVRLRQFQGEQYTYAVFWVHAFFRLTKGGKWELHYHVEYRGDIMEQLFGC